MSNQLKQIDLGTSVFLKSSLEFDPGLRMRFHKNLLQCSKCSRRSSATSPVPPTGPDKANWVFMGRDPGKTEDSECYPFHPEGKGGRAFTLYLSILNVYRSDSYVTNTLFCYGPKEPSFEEVSTCTTFWKTLEFWFMSSAKYVFLMGNHAVRTVFPWSSLSVLNMQGTYAKVGSKVIFPLIHPGTLLRRPLLQAEFYRNLELIAKMIRS